ncbi:helix-turn-helix transcriptional regulator [Paucibacter sp. Y2R2-4]|uniref:helix-turn-helix transcriptional regulator n=1 Tax=Paucibacter sp. Y2R2-4 TaxID=2893553 RepID=UPI00398CA0B3
MASVVEFTGFSRATIYRYIKEGQFPSPCKIGQWASRWKAGEVRAWLEAQKGGAQ